MVGLLPEEAEGGFPIGGRVEGSLTGEGISALLARDVVMAWAPCQSEVDGRVGMREI